MILECALEYGANAIISGDEHLLALAAFEDIPILTPAQYLEKKQSSDPGTTLFSSP